MSTPPPGVVGLKGETDGTEIGNVGDSLKVTVTSGGGGGSVTQGTTPWVDNISQFGGSNVVTGTGASGSGIPRVTISSDSSITNITGTVSLPTGASTAANQTNVQSAAGTPVGVAITVQGNASGVAIPVSGTFTPSGTQNVNVTEINGSAVSTAATGVQKVGAVGSTGTALDSAAGTPNAQAITIQGNSSGVAVPVSAATLPLPTGAATSLNQTNASQKTQIVDGSGTVIGPAQTVSGSNYLPVVLAASATPGSAVVPRSIQVAGTDGTDARTLLTDSTGKLITTAAAPSGNTPLQFVRNVYSSTNVTTGAYVQLIASTSGITNVIETFDSSGQTLKIAFGAMGSEVDQFLITPGGNGRNTVNIASGTRVSIRAVSATASSGEFDMNLYT